MRAAANVDESSHSVMDASSQNTDCWTSEEGRDPPHGEYKTETCGDRQRGKEKEKESELRDTKRQRQKREEGNRK